MISSSKDKIFANTKNIIFVLCNILLYEKFSNICCYLSHINRCKFLLDIKDNFKLKKSIVSLFIFLFTFIVYFSKSIVHP